MNNDGPTALEIEKLLVGIDSVTITLITSAKIAITKVVNVNHNMMLANTSTNNLILINTNDIVTVVPNM